MRNSVTARTVTVTWNLPYQIVGHPVASFGVERFNRESNGIGERKTKTKRILRDVYVYAFSIGFK